MKSFGFTKKCLLSVRSLSVCLVLAGSTSQLNGTNVFSELVLARMDQSRSVLPLLLPKAREFGELWRENCTRAPWTFPFKPVRTSSFGPVRADIWKETLATNLISKGGLVGLALACH